MKANWKNCIILYTLALLLASITGHAEEHTPFRFELWNNCEPVRVNALPLSGAESIITSAEVVALVTNKLWDAGIRMDEHADTGLDVVFDKVGLSLYVQIDYEKYHRVQDNVSQAKGVRAITWTTSIGVPYARFTNLDSIKIAIGAALDNFISTYLWANADACAHRQN